MKGEGEEKGNTGRSIFRTEKQSNYHLANVGPVSNVSSLSMVICLVNANILWGVSMYSFTGDTGVMQCSLVPICLRRVISVTELWKICFIEAEKLFLTNVRTELRPCVQSIHVWVTDLTLALSEPQLFSTQFQKTLSFQIPCLLHHVETTAVDGSVPVAFCHIT